MSAPSSRVVNESLLFLGDRLITSSKVNFKICRKEDMLLCASIITDCCPLKEESVRTFKFEVKGNDCALKALKLKITPAPEKVCMEESWTSELVENTLFIWTNILRQAEVCLLLNPSVTYQLEAVASLRGRCSNVEKIEVF